MSGFAPGDVVVCVGTGTCERCEPDPDAPPIGSVHRVLAVTPEGDWLWLMLSRLPYDDWCPCTFRKIDPASENFTAEMRACRPIKHREPANA